MCIEYYVFSIDEETLEREPLEDEDKPKSDNSDSAIIGTIVI